MKNVNNQIEAIEHAVLPVPHCNTCGAAIGPPRKAAADDPIRFILNTNPTPEDLARPKNSRSADVVCGSRYPSARREPVTACVAI